MTEKNLFKQHPLAIGLFAALNLAPAAQAASDIVISQVYGGGGNSGATYKNDFIELFNRGAAAVSLNGMSVQYSSSTGTSWSKTNLTNITLQPGQYYLLQQAAGTGGTTNLPTPDTIGTLALSSSSGKVALVNTQTTLGTISCPNASNGVVDFIGFGSGANCSETSPTSSSLTNTTAAIRTGNGCTDTDNNNADFVTTGAPNPRNSASALNSCTTSATAVNLSVSVNEGTEAGTTAITVTATAAAAVTGDQTVNLTVSGTNITSTDYTLSNTSITILSGATSGSVTFTVNDDANLESLETATLAINSVSTGLSLGTTTSQNITLADNDACGTSATKISAVQGTDNGSTHVLNGVAGTTIEGIVVGDYQGTSAKSLRGFFVQEENADADGNPATSEGIFIFDGSNAKPSVSVGDKVRVTGTRSEFFDMTQLGTLTDVQICATGQALPSPASLTLPVPNVPNGDLTTATAAINTYYEAFEGMLVTFPTALKVSEYFELERYGQLLLGQGGRIQTFTNASNPSVTGYINHQINLAKRQIILDDKDNTQNSALTNNQALFYPTDGAGGIADGLSLSNRLRGGDTLSNLTGVLHWSFAGVSGTDAWRIRPVDELYDYVFTITNKRKATPPAVGGSLKVASFNVLNYFTTLDTTTSNTTGICSPDGTQDCRGADSSIELSQQKAKAGAALCGLNADIIGLMEVENNASASLQDLADAANSVCGAGTYDYIPTGVIGTDAIKVGLLYKTATVAPINSFALLNSSVSSNFIDTKNRPSLAQSFEQLTTGERLTVAVNHLKSKGSDCNDISFDGNVSFDVDAQDGQGNCNITRKKAAEVLVSWLATYPTGIIDNDNLIIGDLNSYAKEDPVKAIENGGYTNLVKKFSGASAYSYVFDGQLGYLDHALASSSLVAQVTGAGDWHINADEPPAFDYNDAVATTGEASFEVKPSATPLYAANAYRTSDHDPVMIGLQLASVINTINGSPAKDTLTGTTGNDRISGLAGADKLTGGTGADAFVYALTTDGIDTVTDFVPGEDVIDLTALLLNIGYQGDNPIGDGIVKFAASGSNSVVYIDVDGAGATAQRALLIVNNVSVASLNNPSNFKF